MANIHFSGEKADKEEAKKKLSFFDQAGKCPKFYIDQVPFK